MSTTQNLRQHFDAAIASLASRIPFARLERLQRDELDRRGYLPEFLTAGARALVFRHKSTGDRVLYSPRLGTWRIVEE